MSDGLTDCMRDSDNLPLQGGLESLYNDQGTIDTDQDNTTDQNDINIESIENIENE